MQRVLLRVPRRGAGAVAPVAREGRDGPPASARVTVIPSEVEESAPLLFINASQVVTCAGLPTARKGAAMNDAAIKVGVAVLIVNDRIAAVDDETTLRTSNPRATII